MGVARAAAARQAGLLALTGEKKSATLRGYSGVNEVVQQ
jgi:hypothetical protein